MYKFGGAQSDNLWHIIRKIYNTLIATKNLSGILEVKNKQKINDISSRKLEIQKLETKKLQGSFYQSANYQDNLPKEIR